MNLSSCIQKFLFGSLKQLLLSRVDSTYATMPYSVMAGLLLFLTCIVLFFASEGADASTFCQSVVRPLGYGCAEFTVQTDDGFVLSLHRLSRITFPSGENNDNRSGNHPDKHTSGRTPGEGQTPSNSGNGSIQDGLAPSSSRSSHSTAPSPAPFLSSNNSSRNISSEEPSMSRPAQNETTNSTRSQTDSHTSTFDYRIHPGAGKNAPVLLLHQEFLNGDTWFQYVDNQRVGHLLPLMLFDDGFDVWIGHQRATYWGHGHVQLKYTDRAYWNWTWDQHAEFDLPAQLRFISVETNQPVHVIGASQAATVAAAGATNHETAQMIRSLTLIGLTAYRGNTNSMLLEAWAFYFGAALDTEYYATGFQNGAFNYTLEFPGNGNITGQGRTGMEIGLISGPNCCLGPATIQVNNGWDGTTSFKNLLHWQQAIRTNNFAHYDYGSAASNYVAYGQLTAPQYIPAQIPRRMPILVIAGGQDWTAPPLGQLIFLRRLRHPVTVYNKTNYAHYDLTFSVTRDNDIYIPILNFLEGHDFA